MTKLPITACVVSYNEGHFLEDCLGALQNVAEIILVDLESTDQTKIIGNQFATKVLTHKKVKVVEHIKSWIVQQAKFDWVLFVDPDEVYSKKLIYNIEHTLKNLPPDVGLIYLPMQFFFKKHSLKAGHWGGTRYRSALINKQYTKFSTDVHGGEILKDGYRSCKIKRLGENFITHKWITSYKQLFEKHNRYIREEGQATYNKGQRYSLLKQLIETYRAFKQALINKKGFKDGFIGIFLSFFGLGIYSCDGNL